MGQRHQIFLIARVQGRHRCIAAFHSQWLYGRMVIYAASRVVRALINPVNAAAIASELATLERLELETIAHQASEDYENPATLCPYLTGLFLTCSRVDMVVGRLYKMNLWHSYYLPSQCDNDEGYTCVDVTEPGKPRYCFLWPGTGPLTAAGYLSRSSEKDELSAPNATAILGHCALLELSTLATVWPDEFAGRNDLQEGGPTQRMFAASPPFSPITRSAESAYITLQAYYEYDPFGPGVGYMMSGLLMAMADYDEGRFRARSLLTATGSDAVPTIPPSALSAEAVIKGILSTPVELGLVHIQSKLDNLVIEPGHLLDVLRTELSAVNELGCNGFILLKQLLAAEKSKIVDLKPWVSTGVLDASRLIDLCDALQHAEFLDLSLSSTLTTEIVEDVVPRLPNLRHLVVLGCTGLTSLTTVLPLSTYLATLPVHEAVDQNRLQEPRRFSPPECLRWVEESDSPAGLSVVTFSPSLSMLSDAPDIRRYGVELSHFGAEGVVTGFAFWMARLYDPEYRAGEGNCYFEMRAYFHATGVIPVESIIPVTFDRSPSFAFGCMPSLIKDVSAGDGHVYPKTEVPAATDGVTRVPRHPGWVLVFDTKGTMPYHQLLRTMSRQELYRRDFDRLGLEVTFNGSPMLPGPADTDEHSSDATAPPSGDSSSPPPGSSQPQIATVLPQRLVVSLRKKSAPVAGSNDASPPAPAPPIRNRFAPPSSSSSPPPPDGAPRPEYAFERWDVRPGEETKGLQPVERLSVREWVGRLPAGHGPVDPKALAYCEHVLARLHVVLRGSTSE